MDRECETLLTPALLTPGRLEGAVAVVVDVLRATTCICHAIAAGAESVRPFADVDRARSEAAQGSPRPLLTGERNGVPLPGFDHGNSPSEFTPSNVGGRRIFMSTTNGTKAILASQPADRIWIGSFSNLGTIADLLREAPRIAVVCSGTHGRVTMEDLLWAGALWDRLGVLPTDDASRLAAEAWRAASSQPLDQAFRESHGGRNLVRIGREDDILAAARIDTLDVAPEYRAAWGEIRSDASQ